jgi:hypothetical protein
MQVASQVLKKFCPLQIVKDAGAAVSKHSFMKACRGWSPASLQRKEATHTTYCIGGWVGLCDVMTEKSPQCQRK